MSARLPQPPEKQPQGRFPLTRWSLISSARVAGPSQESALRELCVLYWYPVYGYVRDHGRGHHDAEDLTQSFFLHLMTRSALEKAERAKGRFRNFLLTILRRFLASHWEKATALKRGGQRKFLSIDEAEADSRYRSELKEDLDPEKLYHRRWSINLLEIVHKKIEEDYAHRRRAAEFALLSEFLPMGEGRTPYSAVAQRLGCTEGAVRVLVFRMRKRYRMVLMEEIMQTLTTREEAEEEIDFLFTSLEPICPTIRESLS